MNFSIPMLSSKGLLGGRSLEKLVKEGVIRGVPPAHINGASVDVRLGSEFYFESYHFKESYSGDPEVGPLGVISPTVVDLSAKDEIEWTKIHANPGERIYIQPGQFFLTHTEEMLDLPDDVSSLFLLRSSCARAGLEHSQAGFGDAGFTGQLTLEMKNITEHQTLVLQPGMRIGQILFFRHDHVGDRSYRLKGRYGGQNGVQVSKGAS